MACDQVRPLFWKTTQHPVLPFSIKTPRSWEITPGGALGTTFSIDTHDQNPIFKFNGNIVIEPSNGSLEKTITQTEESFRKLFKQYETLTLKPFLMDHYKAYELLGVYQALGKRIVNTFLTHTPNHLVVITFSFEQEHAKTLKPLVDQVVQTVQLTF